MIVKSLFKLDAKVKMESKSYAQRGVSSSKSEVHDAIKNLDAGLFPGAFCKVLPDVLAGDPNYCVVMHADGAGTKSSLAYLYWKETGDMSVFRDIAIDSIVMNLDDLACVGALDNLVLSNTIGRNKFLVPGEIIKEVIDGYSEFLATLERLGVNISFAGGETADVGDLVRTIIVDSTLVSRTKRSSIIDANQISPGNVIVGFSSYGQCKWEKSYNSGIGSNGLTSARHDILDKSYKDKYPETFDPNIDKQFVFSGSRMISEELSGSPINVGKAILSPTRTYAPMIKELLSSFKGFVFGLIHCSGGGQSKCLNFGNRIKYKKNELFETPPIFDLIQKETNRDWKEMLSIFNMGHRLEAYVDEEIVSDLISLSEELGIEAKVVGHCEASSSSKNELEITYKGETLLF